MVEVSAPAADRSAVSAWRGQSGENREKIIREIREPQFYEESLFHDARVHGGGPFLLRQPHRRPTKAARAIAQSAMEKRYQSLARSRARLRAMEAAGNLHWLRREPAHHDVSVSNSDAYLPDPPPQLQSVIIAPGGVFVWISIDSRTRCREMAGRPRHRRVRFGSIGS